MLVKSAEMQENLHSVLLSVYLFEEDLKADPWDKALSLKIILPHIHIFFRFAHSQTDVVSKGEDYISFKIFEEAVKVNPLKVYCLIVKVQYFWDWDWFKVETDLLLIHLAY